MNYNKELSRRNRGIYTFRVQGQMYHFMNPLRASHGQPLSNVQLYFFDTDHETSNRMAISPKFKESIIEQLQRILDCNPHSALFRHIAGLPKVDEYKIFLIIMLLKST